MQFTIDGLGPRGDGYHNGPKGRIYVDRSVPGDELDIKTKRNKSGVVQGDIKKIIKASQDRTAPPCAYYDVCGGCTLQHVSETYYKKWKQDVVTEALNRQSLEPKNILEPIFIEGESRRRVTFSAFQTKGQTVLGYKKRRSKMINDIKECLNADPTIMQLQPILKQHLSACLQPGRGVEVLIQKVGGVFDVVFTGPVGQKETPDLSVLQLAADLIHQTKIARVSWRENFHDECETLVEKEPVKIKFGKLEISLPAAAFLQPTDEGERALVNAVLSNLPNRGQFADLFSGCGTFSGPMLEKGSVDAFETNENAIKALNKEAQFKGFPLVAIERDLFKLPLSLEELSKYDALVFDPPRAGANRQAAILANSSIKTIIAVSCNPVSFAKDARVLTEGGYEFESVQLVDQFTKSHHVEMVGVFKRN